MTWVSGVNAGMPMGGGGAHTLAGAFSMEANLVYRFTGSLQPFSYAKVHSVNGRAKAMDPKSFFHPLLQTHFRRTLTLLRELQNECEPAPYTARSRQGSEVFYRFLHIYETKGDINLSWW